MATVVQEIKKDKGKTPMDSSSSSSSGDLPKISLRIPSFKGEAGENVVVWLRQTKNILRAQKVTDESIMIHYAATGFEDAALHWFVNKVKDTTGPAFTDWVDFTKALKDAFQPPHYQQYLRTQLKHLHQTGDIQEYTSQFRNVVSQIDNMGPLDQVAYYIDGLKPATKMEVSYQAPETLDEAWKLAIRYDTAKFGLGKPTIKVHTSYKQKSHKNNGFRPMELDQTEVRKSYHNNAQQKNMFTLNKKDIVCYNCGKKGHMSKECRSPPRQK